MAENKRNIKISSPGQIGRYVMGFDVIPGDLITSAQVTSTAPAELSGANVTVSDATENVDGDDYPAGHAVIFTIIAVANMVQRTRNDDPFFILVTIQTNGAEPAEDDLTFAKEIDVYPQGIPVP